MNARPDFGGLAPARRKVPKRSARLMAEAQDWLPVLRQLGATSAALRRIVLLAEAHQSSFRSALMETALFSERDVCRALAAAMQVDFIDELQPELLIGSDETFAADLSKINQVGRAQLDGPNGPVTTLIAPRDVEISELRKMVAMRANDGPIAFVPPEILRTALAERLSDRLTDNATNGLFDLDPAFSARDRFSRGQGVATGFVLVALALLCWWAPLAVFIAVHILGSAFFIACTMLKATALLSKRPRRRSWSRPTDLSNLPVYSVLVALHREDAVVPQLIAALERLDWPRDRLEIKLVCEADDTGTIEAILACKPSGIFEITRVPPSRPRTKPKALRYALTMTTGEFVVLYDAEDRPHPEQLMEAFAHFRKLGPEVVCLQAPLTVTNGQRSILARMFAFEYAGLFRSVLPWLAHLHQALPLGGTSNHFRREALEAVGSWDPHNVTEDADLGVRLFRHGRRAETITLPTLEAAPEQLKVWLPQRTRWLKGWLQTWLVHMRDPLALLREIGLPSFLVTQILLAGMFFSALLHPVVFLTAPVYLGMYLMGGPLAAWQIWLLALDWTVLLTSYAVFLAVGWRSLTKRERTGFPVIVLATPFYWLLIAWAAWMALFEFIRHPHRWNKTPHKPGG